MVLKILRDAYHYFDRRWVTILGGAAIAVGIFYLINYLIITKLHLPVVMLGKLDNEPVKFDYRELAAIFTLTLISFWYEAFIAMLIKSEIESNEVNFRALVFKTVIVYPRVLIAKIATQIIIGSLVLLALPGLALTPLGLIFLVPAVIYAIRLSLVAFTTVVENESNVVKALRRSSYLVSRYSFAVLFIIMTSMIPLFATIGVEMNSKYFLAIDIIISVASAVLSMVLMASTYLNLRLAKGESLNKNLQELINESEEV